MIEEITKFGTKLKPTQYTWKSQLYRYFLGFGMDSVRVIISTTYFSLVLRNFPLRKYVFIQHIFVYPS